jgi:uncharacterized LabA/DUF88 family protein
MEKKNRIALFIDLDNFVGFCLDDDLPLDIKKEIKKLTEHGDISIRRSFGDIMKLPISETRKRELREMLQANLIRHEDIPYYNGYKNTSDIRLAIEAMSIAYTHPDINIFAIIANDRDYMPVFSKLKEIGKTIIGIGSTKTTVGELYRSACDIFYYHEDFGKNENTVKKIDMTIADDENSLIDLLIEKVIFNTEHGLKTNQSTIAAAIKNSRAVDFTTYKSFQGFGDLCRLVEKRGMLSIMPRNVGDLDPVLSCNSQENEAAIFSFHGQQKEAQQSDTSTSEDMVRIYNNFIKTKLSLKTDFPQHAMREKIYQQLDILLAESEPYGGVGLKAASEQVTKALAFDPDDQSSVFKILYSLYRSGCFIVRRTEDNYNPIIMSNRVAMNYVYMDKKLMESLIKLFKWDSEDIKFDPGRWSEFFIGDTSYSQIAKFAYNYL